RFALDGTCHQPGQLRPAKAAGGAQVAQHPSALGPLEPVVAKTPQHLGYVLVARRIVTLWLELDRERPAQERPYLIQRADLRFVHVDHHPIDDRPTPATHKRRPNHPLQAHTSLESREPPVQAHTSLDKTQSFA